LKKKKKRKKGKKIVHNLQQANEASLPASSFNDTGSIGWER